MSTERLVARVRADKAAIVEAALDGRLPPKSRGLHHLGIDVVDYSAPAEDLTDDELTILRETIDVWMRKGRHEGVQKP